MAKSIKHWMVAVGIARRLGSARAVEGYELTRFGHSMLEADPHLLSPTSWWLLHINLVNTPDFAASWSWFFNRWNQPRFDRPVCIEGLRRALNMQSKRVPSERTLSRDMGCLLSSYAQSVPPLPADPEDAAECPLQQLGLIRHYKASGHYVLNTHVKDVHPLVIAYAIAKSDESNHVVRQGKTEYSLRELERLTGGPGRCAMLNADGLFEIVNAEAESRGRSIFKVDNQAGERVVVLSTKTADEWAELAFETVEEGACATA